MPVNDQQAQKIPGDRGDGRSSLTHLAIITSGKIGALAPYYLIPLWVALFFLTNHIWQQNKLAIGILAGISFAADWLVLGFLPVKHRSWGPVTPPLLALMLLRSFCRMIVGYLRVTVWGLILIFVIELAISLIVIYATWVEPFNIVIARYTMNLPAGMVSSQFRILHVSDIHYEGDSPREAKLLEIIDRENPDLIVLTGDYLNLSSVFDPVAQRGVFNLLRQVHAPQGVYAVTGSPAVDHEEVVPAIFKQLPIHWLQDQAISLSLNEFNLCIVGIVNTYNENRDISALNQVVTQCPKQNFKLLLYHTPDMMPDATELGINLYLCGHTHGGQISLPFYGALVTSSKWGKRYERGLYHAQKTFLYVSRGLGVEGMGAPRARLCASPEVIVWTFVPDATLTDEVSIV